MGLFDSKELKAARARITELESAMTPEMRNADMLRQQIAAMQTQLTDLQNAAASIAAQNQHAYAELQSKRAQIVETDEEILLQSFGLYKPMFDFATSDEYKAALERNRYDQKMMIKNGEAASGNMGWTVNGDLKKGQRMVADMQKLLLRAFNGECDELVGKVKFNTFDSCLKRIDASEQAISKLGSIMGVAIAPRYVALKRGELRLAYEYQLKKQAEKEEQKRIREEMKEQAKLQKELEEERKRIEKEQAHYQNAYQKIVDQISRASGDELAALEAKKAEMEQHLSELDQAIATVDYRAANARAGYVYVISNIGAFGENVYKIGMTRRLDPMDRVDELGDASVPFSFDVHALIFSDDAPRLEAALHHAFEDRKVNMINGRKEFFRVTLDEIEAVVRQHHDKTVEFIRTPPAEQYRQSLFLQK